jgi:hypothetical protein
VRRDEVVARSLKQRAPVEAQRLDDVTQAVLDLLVYPLGLEIDESRRQIDDERLEADALRDVGRDVIPPWMSGGPELEEPDVMPHSSKCS